MNRISEKLWKLFSSVRLGIGLLISIAVSTMIGSIILQRPIAEPGQLERVYSPETIVWLDRFQLLDVFHSWWFVLQMALLALNVTIVSIDMWPRFKRRMQSFSPILNDQSPLPAMHASIRCESPKIDSPESMKQKLKSIFQKRFRNPIVSEKDGKTFFAAQSARFAHLGVYIIHTGIVVILIGGLIGNKEGFEGHIQLSPFEKTNFYFDRKEPGKRVPLGFEIRCLGARMEKYPDGSPKSYFSDLEIVDPSIDPNKAVAKKTIKVNDPLEYKGIYFYQATFGQKPVDEKTSITVQATDRKTGKTKMMVTDFERQETLPTGSGFLKVVDYVPNLPLDIEGHRKDLGEAIKLELSEDGKEPLSIWLFKDYPDFDEKVRTGKYNLVFHHFDQTSRLENVTGIQVARNPGITITWIGCIILLAGMLSTFLVPHRQLWFVLDKDGKGIVVAAISHRHPETFGEKVKKIVKDILESLGQEARVCHVTWSPKLLESDFSGSKQE